MYRAKSSRSFHRTKSTLKAEEDFGRRTLRDEYEEKMDAMWMEFKHKAVNGTVTFEEAFDILSGIFSGVTESMLESVDPNGDDGRRGKSTERSSTGYASSNEHISTTEEYEEETDDDIGYTFDALRLVAEMVVAASRDTNVVHGLDTFERGDGDKLVKVVKLSMWDFFVHRINTCMGRPPPHQRGHKNHQQHDQQQGGDDHEDTSSTSATSSAEEDDQQNNAIDTLHVEYRLDFDCSWRPRELLLTISSVLMLFISFIIVMIITLLWISNTEEFERGNVERFGIAMAALGQSFENEFMVRHGEGMVEEAKDVGNRVESEHRSHAAREGAEIATLADEATAFVSRVQRRGLKRYDRLQRARGHMLAKWHEAAASAKRGDVPLTKMTIDGLTEAWKLHEVQQLNNDAATKTAQPIEQRVGSTTFNLGCDIRGLSSVNGTFEERVVNGYKPIQQIAERAVQALDTMNTATEKAHVFSFDASAEQPSTVDHTASAIFVGKNSHAAIDLTAETNPISGFSTASTTTPSTIKWQRKVLSCDILSQRDVSECQKWARIEDVATEESRRTDLAFREAAEVAASDGIPAVPCFVNIGEVRSPPCLPNYAKTNANYTLATVEMASDMIAEVGIDSAEDTAHTSSSHPSNLNYFTSSRMVLSAPPTAANSNSTTQRSIYPIPINTIVSLRRQDVFLNRVSTHLIETVEFLNFAFVRSTELVVGGINKTTGEQIPQFTAFRFSPGCYDMNGISCQRFLPSARNFIAGLQDHGSGWSITPDYRPEPVIGAYRWIGAGISQVFLIERDVIEIRKTGLNFLAKIADAINVGRSGSSEIEFIERVGSVGMKYFFSEDPCPEGTDCETLTHNDSYVIFQYGCQHCQRMDRPTISTQFTHITAFKKDVQCRDQADGVNCSWSSSRPSIQSRQQYREALEGQELVGESLDYVGEDVLYYADRIENYSVGIVVKIDRAEYLDPIIQQVGVAMAVNISFIVAGVLIVLASSSSALTNVETEWKQKEKDIERSKLRFVKLSRAIMPAQVHSKLIRGTKFISDSIPSTGFVAANACKFSEIIRHYNHRHVVRLSGYMEYVLGEIAEAAQLTKLRAIGDIFLALATREDIETEKHPTRRIMVFAVAVLDLFSKTYRHCPQNSQDLRLTFADYHKTVKALPVPAYRIGAHFGGAVLGAVGAHHPDSGQTANFDCYGPALAITQRMCTNSEPHRMMVTATFKDTLVSNDPDRLFTFDHSKKATMRYGGTTQISMHFVRSSRLPLLYNLMNHCGIEPAIRSISLDPDVLRQQGMLGEQSSLDGASSKGSTVSETPRSSISGGSSWYQAPSHASD